MKRNLSVVFLLVVTAFVSTVFAQPKFIVPITVGDGVAAFRPVYFGIKPSANFCIVDSDSLYGQAETQLPPAGPALEARFIWPRTGSDPICYGGGSYVDIRPYTSASQKDTFKVKAQPGDGTQLLFSWPANLSTRFTKLTFFYLDGNTFLPVNVDMLTNTSTDATVALAGQITIYSGGLNPLSVEQTSSGLPEGFALSQNYPNPFNPSTKLQFAIERSAVTDISVYNILGQRVTTLASGLLAPGYYTVTWGGENSVGGTVSSGVYFVRMTAEANSGASFSAMRKVLFMK